WYIGPIECGVRSVVIVTLTVVKHVRYHLNLHFRWLMRRQGRLAFELDLTWKHGYQDAIVPVYENKVTAKVVHFVDHSTVTVPWQISLNGPDWVSDMAAKAAMCTVDHGVFSLSEGASESSLSDFLNSLYVLPTALPTSGSRLGPKISKAMTVIMISSGQWNPIAYSPVSTMHCVVRVTVFARSCCSALSVAVRVRYPETQFAASGE